MAAAAPHCARPAQIFLMRSRETQTPQSYLYPPHKTQVQPLTSSLANAWMRMDAPLSRPPQPLLKVQAFNPLQSNQALHTSMASFPTTGQPVMHTTLKNMLLSLQTALMTDHSSLFNNISTDIHTLDNTTTETGIEECTTMVNDIIDIYEEVKEEQDWVQAKLADLEDRLRRNNVKLRRSPKLSCWQIYPDTPKSSCTKFYLMALLEISLLTAHIE